MTAIHAVTAAREQVRFVRRTPEREPWTHGLFHAPLLAEQAPSQQVDRLLDAPPHHVTTVRPATEPDWPHIFPFYAALVADGKTYAFPEGQTLEEARPWWMEKAPGQTVVAV